MQRCRLFLASASPRRRELLSQIGIHPLLWPVNLDERAAPDELPTALVSRLARGKAGAVIERLNLGERPDAEHRSGERWLVLAADTVIEVEQVARGKPENREQAIDWLLSLSGRAHQVHTALCLWPWQHETPPADPLQDLVSTEVHFGPVSRAQAEAYWASGEPVDKAGGYAIQGLGALFVERLNGSYSNVVGLPLFETAALLAAAGCPALGATSCH